MPELSVIHITIIAVVTVVGALLGWVFRGKRAAEEKSVVNAGWQEQISAQRIEHDRLTDQNKALMEQISQYMASNKDAKNRAKDLSESVQEANERRDQLQREIKEVRSTLESALSERDQLQSEISSQAVDVQDAEAKDIQIEKLRKSLDGWQDRLPPLVEKFREKNEEANQLASELTEARERIEELEAQQILAETRIEAVRDPEELTAGRDASNDAIERDENDAATNDDEHNEAEEGVLEELVVPADDLEPQDEQFVIDEVDDDEVSNELDVEDEDDDDGSESNTDYDQGDDSSDVQLNGGRDDLKSIKGIGPAIEKTLNELGIFNFQQIADMSEYDIDRVAKTLKGFRSRIYREDWIGQARNLSVQHLSD